jgi:hypothetical protein
MKPGPIWTDVTAGLDGRLTLSLYRAGCMVVQKSTSENRGRPTLHCSTEENPDDGERWLATDFTASDGSPPALLAWRRLWNRLLSTAAEDSLNEASDAGCDN